MIIIKIQSHDYLIIGPLSMITSIEMQTNTKIFKKKVFAGNIKHSVASG